MTFGRFEDYLANKFIVFGILFISALLVYHDAINHDFIIFDDQVYLEAIQKNDLGLWSLISFAFTNIVNANWHPFTMVSLIVDYKIYGNNPGGYHVTSLILHLLNAFFVYLIFRQLTTNYARSFLIATIFLLHPLNVETVAWIAERKGVLAAFFSLGSIYFYVKYRTQEKRKYFILSIVAFFAALMSKAVFVTLPILFIIIDIYLATLNNVALTRNHLASFIKTQIPLFGISVIFGVVTILAHTASGALGAAEYVPWILRIGKAIAFIPIYLRQLIYPAELAIPYPYHVPGINTIIVGGVIIAGFTILSLAFRKKYPYLFLGWFWYIVLLIPVSGIIQSGFHAHADRYAYLPLIGIVFFLVFFSAEIIRQFHINKKLSTFMALLLIMILMFSSWMQHNHWKNSFALFYNTYTIDKENYMANTLLSGLYIHAGDFEKGMQFYRQARDSEPTYLQLYDKISTALMLKNQPDLAASVLEDSLIVFSFLSKSYGAKYNNLRDINIKEIAKIRISQKKYNEASLILNDALKQNPDDLELFYLFGRLNYGRGDYELAETYLKDVLMNQDDHYQANYLLILVYIHAHKIAQAQSTINLALEKFPDKKDEIQSLAGLIN